MLVELRSRSCRVAWPVLRLIRRGYGSPLPVALRPTGIASWPRRRRPSWRKFGNKHAQETRTLSRSRCAHWPSHREGCDIERCPHCGWQALGCSHFDPNDARRRAWNGKWPSVDDCERLNFFVNDDPDLPDLNPLLGCRDAALGAAAVSERNGAACLRTARRPQSSHPRRWLRSR